MPTPRKHDNQAARQRAYLERQKAARLAIAQTKNMPPVSGIATMPSAARWRALTGQAQTILQTIQTEMEDYRDERSEAWRDSEKCEAFQETIDRINEALESVAAIEL